MSVPSARMITDLFVYGTLKRGECRDSLWPRKPLAVKDGFVRARLYDLGPYPAIRVDGEEIGSGGVGGRGVFEDLDWVKGEVWSFDREDVATTIKRLDEIEETNQRGFENLYDHVVVRAFDEVGSTSSCLALAYQYSCEDRLAGSKKLRPEISARFVEWSAEARRD